MAAADLIAVWERGQGESVAGRALAMLSAAEPELGDEERASLPVGRRDARLLDLRERLFGARFSGTTTCPSCSDTIELKFDASDVRRDARDDAPLVAHSGEWELELRLPDSRDLFAIEGMRSVAEARAALLARCVVRASREGELPPQIEEAVTTTLASADPQADVHLELSCPACGHAWREPFDVVSFLWTEIAAQAQRLLADVHLLASAYGWSEEAILRLSPARRNAYIGMVR